MKILILMISLISCNRDIKGLVSKYKGVEEYWRYIEEDNDKELRDFLSKEENKYININKEIDKKGEIALTLASKLNNIKVLNLLLDDEYINVDAKNVIGRTALMYAAEKGYTNIVELLIEKGANFDDEDIYNNTALYVASENGHIEVVKLLIDKGAYVNIKNNYGWTSLYVASNKGHIEIIKLLIKAGANVNYKDAESKTVLMHASNNGHTEIVYYIIKEMLKYSKVSKELIHRSINSSVNKEDALKEINNNINLLQSLLSLPKDILNLIVKELN